MKTIKIKPDQRTYAYDSAEDILYVRLKKNHYQSSVEKDGIILDYNKKGEVIGIEILHASQLFHGNKKLLRNIMNGTVTIAVNQRSILVTAALTSQTDHKKFRETARQRLSSDTGLVSQKLECIL